MTKSIKINLQELKNMVNETICEIQNDKKIVTSLDVMFDKNGFTKMRSGVWAKNSSFGELIITQGKTSPDGIVFRARIGQMEIPISWFVSKEPNKENIVPHILAKLQDKLLEKVNNLFD